MNTSRSTDITLGAIRDMKRKLDELAPEPPTDLVVTPAHEQSLRRHMGELRADGLAWDTERESAYVRSMNPQAHGIELHVARNEQRAVEIMKRLHRDKRRWGIVDDPMLSRAAAHVIFLDFPDLPMALYPHHTEPHG